MCGSPRVRAELVLGDGERIGRKRVERLIRQAGIAHLRRTVRGRRTIRVSRVYLCEDLVDRAVLASAPNRLWVADVTSLRAGGLAICYRGPRRLLAPDRRLIDGGSPPHRAGHRRAAEGAPAPTPCARTDLAPPASLSCAPPLSSFAPTQVEWEFA